MDKLLRETVKLTAQRQYPEMSESTQRMIESLVVRREVKKGEQLVVEGQICKNIILVGQGMIRQYYFKNKKDVTEHFSYEGCVAICLESTLKQEPTHLLAEAIEDSIVYYLPYQDLLKAAETSWELNIFYRKILEYSLITSQKKADGWRFETAHERYERLWREHPEIIRRAPLAHIASYLLMSPETLSRVRAGVL